MKKTLAFILAAAAIANAVAEDGSAPANAAERPDLASLATPQTFTYKLRDVYLTREIEDLSIEETNISRSGDSTAIRTKTSVTGTTSVGDSSVSTDSSEQSSRKKSGTHLNAGGGVSLKWGVVPSVSGSAGLSHSRDWENESAHGQRRASEKRADRTVTITQSGEITDTGSLERLGEVSNKSRIGKYILRFSVMLQNRDSSDTLIVDGDNMLARLRGSGLTGTISVPYREHGAFHIDAGDAITCSFSCEIKDANQLRDLLRLRDEGALNQRLKLDVSGADFPIVSEKTKKNVLSKQKAAELRRPSTLIAVEFGEMEKFSPWCVSRRHTKESGQRGKPVTLREALQAVEAVATNQSDILDGFVFSKEGHLAQIDNRPLLGKDEDYRMFAARFEKKDGAAELHLPTSEILNRTIQDYAKISFFDFTFDEFAEMAVLLPTYFSTLRKEIEEWLAKADDKEASKVLADLLEKRQKEDDVRDLPTDKESITKADVERFRLRAEAGIPEMQNKYAACLLHGWGVASNHVEAAEWFRKAAEQGLAKGQYCLGWCYENGKGVTQDVTEAIKWYRKSGYKVAEILAEAKEAKSLGDWKKVSEKVSAALKLEPDSAEANRLKDEVESHLRGQEKEIIVTVNGNKLTYADAMKTIKRILKAQGTSTGKLESQARQIATNALPQIVEQFISTTLLKAEATKRGFTATASDIDDAVNNIVARLPDSMTFADILEKQGLSLEEARKEIAEGLTINKLIEEVTKDIVVDEDAVVKFYEENAPRFERPEQVEASHILIKVDNTDGANAKADAKAKAESIRRRILQGEDFSELAKAHSDCPSRTQGGNLGLFGRGQMVKPFEEAAFTLNKNEISDVVETEYGYHIIKVTDKKPAGKTPLSEVREQIEKQFLDEKKMETVQKLIDLLKSKADIYVNEHFQKETP